MTDNRIEIIRANFKKIKDANKKVLAGVVDVNERTKKANEYIADLAKMFNV